MNIVQCDAKGRIYLRDKLRAAYGDTFVAVAGPREIILLPITDDAVGDLRNATKPLRGKSMKTLKREIAAELRRQSN